MSDRVDAMLIQHYLDKIAALEQDLRAALALLRYCHDTDDIPVIYTVEELREWVAGNSQAAIDALRAREEG